MATEQWWAVLQDTFRTGRSQIIYVQASSKQQAGENNPGSSVLGGPYSSEAAAQKAHPQGSSGSVPADAGQTTAPTLSDKPVSPLGGLAAIGDFFGRLAEASTWVRVGQVVLGVILVAVGVARITHAVPIATKVAKTVGAVAI